MTPAQAGCTHTRYDEWWVPADPDNSESYGYWEHETKSTTEDIDTGRYRCTHCGLVMYYTGNWRKHWEGE